MQVADLRIVPGVFKLEAAIASASTEGYNPTGKIILASLEVCGCASKGGQLWRISKCCDSYDLMARKSRIGLLND
jgi:hypothetical protein